MPRPFGPFPFIINSVASPINVADLDTNFSQVTTWYNDSSIGYVNYGTDSGTANTYIVTIPGTFSSYAQGMAVAFAPNNANSGILLGSTINVNTVGTVGLTDANGNQAGLELIKPGAAILCVFDGTQFRIVDLRTKIQDFGPITGTQTVNCQGYERVYLACTLSAASTFALTNLAYGTDVQIFISGGNSTNTIKVTATDPAGSSYTVYAYYQISGSGTGRANLGTTGLNQGAGQSGVVFRGVPCTVATALLLPFLALSG